MKTGELKKYYLLLHSNDSKISTKEEILPEVGFTLRHHTDQPKRLTAASCANKNMSIICT